MFQRTGFTLIELMIVVVVIGLLAAMAIPNYIAMQDRSKEASTKANAHTLQLAVEDCSLNNGGSYSVAGADVTPFLPGQGLLVNSFSGLISEPHFGAPAGTPGEIGLEAVFEGGTIVGYTITAFGKSDNVLSIKSGNN